MMNTRKITLREFREIVKRCINEETITVYRGEGNNIGTDRNEGFTWVALDRSVARQYSYDEENVKRFEIPKPQNVFHFNYKSNVHVRSSDIREIIMLEVEERYNKGEISDESLEHLLELLENYVDAAGDKMERYHTKINKPGASKILAHIFSLLGFDAIGVPESNSENKNTITYGLINKNF